MSDPMYGVRLYATWPLIHALQQHAADLRKREREEYIARVNAESEMRAWERKYIGAASVIVRCTCGMAQCNFLKRHGAHQCPYNATGGILNGTYLMCDECRVVADQVSLRENQTHHIWVSLDRVPRWVIEDARRQF